MVKETLTVLTAIALRTATMFWGVEQRYGVLQLVERDFGVRVLLGFTVVLGAASSIKYLLEHTAQLEVFGSMPAAPCTLLRLDILEFRELMRRQPDLARVIYDAAHQRLEAFAAEAIRKREETLHFRTLGGPPTDTAMSRAIRCSMALVARSDPSVGIRIFPTRVSFSRVRQYHLGGVSPHNSGNGQASHG